MSRFPWRDTSTDIAGGQPPQWETPQGAQKKADDALKESKDYTDEQNVNFNAHIEDTTIHVTPADKANWNSKAPGVHTHANATPTTPGFMSAEDKTKLNGVEAEANKYVHPATHPPAIIAQDTSNRFVSDAEKAAWSAKAEPTEATTTVKGLMSPADKQKLNGIEATAEVNQNAFSGVNGVVATSKSDTLQLTGGTGITITEDAVSKRLTVTATGEATPGAHASSHITGGTDVIPDAVIGGSSGLMSGADAKFVRQDGESKTGAQAKADAVKEYVDERISAIPPVNDASQTEKGITMLSDATDGTRSNVAATEKAVGLAFQAGVERKAEVVAALNSIGVSASTSESWDALIAKMSGVIRATGTAAVSQVLAGTTFSNATGNNRSGTMVNRGAVSQDITTQNGTYVVPQGYHSGSGIIRAVFANLIAANIRNGVNVGGVVGTLNEGIRYATGTTWFPSNPAQFRKVTNEIINKYYLEVNGLAFKPKIIVISMESGVDIDPGSSPYPQSSIYTEKPIRRNNGSSATGFSTVTTANGDRIYVDGTYSFVTTTGFRLPIDINYTNINLTWYAFDI
ncbi:tail fiber protein [Paenibacillus amylolyticus]|uniref:tail fiber protein n=1 Tax=Paenibacillus amylolyticus TaxID=1451 RepID=UPI0032424D4B